MGRDGRLRLPTSNPRRPLPTADVAHVIDTTGAGDTFIGACIAALSQSLPVPSVLQRGCRVAGKKVAQDGFAGLRAAFEDRKDR